MYALSRHGSVLPGQCLVTVQYRASLISNQKQLNPVQQSTLHLYIHSRPVHTMHVHCANQEIKQATALDSITLMSLVSMIILFVVCTQSLILQLTTSTCQNTGMCIVLLSVCKLHTVPALVWTYLQTVIILECVCACGQWVQYYMLCIYHKSHFMVSLVQFPVFD